MPVYKADKPDFDTRITITATDSEGNVIPDAPIPAGHTLTVTNSNPAAFATTQDAADPKLLHNHVGGPNPDGTEAQSSVVATLTDPAGNIVATGSDLVTVTVGDPAAIQTISLNLPAN